MALNNPPLESVGPSEESIVLIQGLFQALLPWLRAWVEDGGMKIFPVPESSADVTDLYLIRYLKAILDARIEVGAFYWTASAPEIVNSGRKEECSVSVYTAWGAWPPKELWGLSDVNQVERRVNYVGG